MRSCVFGCILLLLSQNGLFAQSAPGRPMGGERPKIGKVTGRVVDATDNLPIEFAAVALVGRSGEIVTGGVTDKKGQFAVEQIPAGKYILNIQFIGYKAYRSDSMLLTMRAPEKNLGDIRLEPTAENLQEVRVQGEKPVFVHSIDKKVFNVEKSVLSEGGNATDVLENIPSIQVDIDGNVSLRGSGNVTILLDGRPSGLSGSNRAAILQQIPANTIESVELITNPSSKYDPDGMTGIINIVLKKNKLQGTNGSISVSAGTGEKYNGSINLNYRTGKFSLFSNYGYRSHLYDFWGESRRRNFSADTTYFFNNDNSGSHKRGGHNFRLGGDYFLNSTNTLGFTFNGNLNFGSNRETIVYENLDEFSEISEQYRRINEGTDDGQNLDLALNYRKTFAKPKQELTAEVSWSDNADKDSTDYLQENVIPIPGSFRERYITDNTVKVNTYQMDYTHPFGLGSKLETGFKSILRESDNDFVVNDLLEGAWLPDTNLTNHFIYKEQIHAVYANLGTTLGPVGVQAGVRAEKAGTQSDQLANSSHYSKSYFSLFPSAFFSLKLNDRQEFKLSYSRRINRPEMHSLNPFADYSDPQNVRVGNPYLRPEYVNSYELSFSQQWEKFYLTSSLYFRQTNDIIQRYRVVDTLGSSIVSEANMDQRRNYGFEFITRVSPWSWWNITSTLNLFQSEIDAGNLYPGLDNRNFNYSIQLMSNTTIRKAWQVQFNGNYNSPGLLAQGERKAMYGVNGGVRRDFLNRKLSFSLNVSDIFQTRQFGMRMTGSNFDQTFWRKRESRFVTLTVTWLFGNMDQQQRKRNQKDGGDGGGMGREDEF